MFGGGWTEAGSSSGAGWSPAPSGQRSDVAAAGPLVNIGDATRALVPVVGRRIDPSGSAARASRAAGRTVARRSYAYKIKQTLDEMAQLLEIPPQVRAELTDEDIVAMSIQFIKKMTPPAGVSQPPREADKNIPLDMYLAALDGFVLHLEGSGTVEYISQNVVEYLGFTAEEIVGKRILDFIHPADRTEVENVLAVGFINNESNQSTSKIRLELFLRMKHQFQKQSNVFNNGGYVVVHYVGFIETLKPLEGSKLPKRPRLSPPLWFIGRPLKPSFVLKYDLNLATFVIRTGLNLQPNFADNELLNLLGYSPWEFSSCTLYHHVHPSDVMDFRHSHKTVLQKGQSLSHYYRMITKCGESLWIQSQFSLICNDFSPSPNCIVILNHVLGGEKQMRRSGATSSKLLNNMVTHGRQFVGPQRLVKTASCNSCEICESGCCYNLPNTGPLTPGKAPLKCDTCDSDITLSTFSKCSSSHFEPNNTSHLQLRNISGERAQSTHTSREIVHNRSAGLNKMFPRYSEKPSTSYIELLQDPCSYSKSLSQSTFGSYKRYEDVNCYPETSRNFTAHSANSSATPPQLSLIPTSVANNFNAYAAMSSAFQREENDPGPQTQETRVEKSPGSRDYNMCAYATQQRSFRESPRTVANFLPHPVMNSLNEMGRSGRLIETYDTRLSNTSTPLNNNMPLQHSYQPLSEFGDTTGWSYPTHSNTNPSQRTGNNSQFLSASNVQNVETRLPHIEAEMNFRSNYALSGPSGTSESNIELWPNPTHSNTNPSQRIGNNNQLLSASNIQNIESSLPRPETQMNWGPNYGLPGPSVSSESNIERWPKLSGYLVDSSTDCSNVSSSSFLQPSSAHKKQDCTSRPTLDLPLVSDSDTGVPKASYNDNLEPDAAVLDEVMRQLDNRLGVAWEIALQKFSAQ